MVVGSNPTSGWSPDQQRFTALDSWRGIAALAVAWGHIEGPAWFLNNVFHQRTGLAVDFFFVLSGFVIAASYGERLRKGFSIVTFMFLRLARLWPLHVTVVAMFVALELVFLALGDLGFLSGREPFGKSRELSSLPSTILLLQAYTHPQEHPWSTASWSISVEVGLYLLAAVLFAFAKRAGWAFGLGIAGLAGAAMIMRIGFEWIDILRGLLGFGAGLALYEAWKIIRRRPPTVMVATILEVAVILGMVLAIADKVKRPEMVVIFAALILIFAFDRGAVSKMLSARLFVLLGAMSYSIYLIHGMVIGRAFDVLGLVQSRIGVRLVESGLGGADEVVAPGWPSAVIVITMLVSSILAASITWRFIEEPARRWSKRKAAGWS
ncbi:acyltransferase family protein [Erythrobacter insulae]|nr:acyltransferase [Erythrobacter insulae]